MDVNDQIGLFIEHDKQKFEKNKLVAGEVYTEEEFTSFEVTVKAKRRLQCEEMFFSTSCQFFVFCQQ
jgi:hypothetical protein